MCLIFGGVTTRLLARAEQLQKVLQAWGDGVTMFIIYTSYHASRMKGVLPAAPRLGPDGPQVLCLTSFTQERPAGHERKRIIARRSGCGHPHAEMAFW